MSDPDAIRTPGPTTGADPVTPPQSTEGVPDRIATANTNSPPQTTDPAQESADGQTRLTEYSDATETGAAAQNTQTEEVTPERRAEIEAFVDEHHDDESGSLWWHDHDGGEKIGAALRGESDLGALTPAEQRVMADRAVSRWYETHNTANVDDAVNEVRGDAVASRALAEALVNPAATAHRHFESGGTYVERPGSSEFRHHMLEAATGLDPAATVAAYEGIEHVLGKHAMDMPREHQEGLLNAVGDRRMSDAAADRLMTSMFVHAKPGDAEALAAPMAEAFAMVSRPGTTQSDAIDRGILQQRMEGILSSEGGRNLLFSENVTPELRAWAFGQAANNSSWTADALDKGWESDIVTTALARQAAEQYSALGTGPVATTGPESANLLRNTVGQALGLRPDMLPPENETTTARDARLAAGMNHQYYADGSHADKVADSIEELGGTGARVSVVPVSVTSNEFGAATQTVFRVERADGSVGFVDQQGKQYDNLQEWNDLNELPPGRFVMPEGLQPGAALTEPQNTRLVTDSFGEWAGKIGDYAAIGVGVVAGVAIVVGTGGTAAIVAAGVAGGYMAGRSGYELYQDSQRGVDVLDFSNPENRSRWLDVAAGTLSIGAIGAGLKVANAARQGVQVSNVVSRSAAGLALAADSADAIAMGDQAIQLAQNWDRLSNADRAMGMLNVAFWGGMTAASARSTGAGVQDAFSFTRLDNALRTGTPYPMETNPALATGEMRVAYETGPDGRATNVRIETGPGTVDRAMLDLHTTTARQVEAAGGLRDRLSALVGNEQPPVGSPAWEAKLEIDKIARENQAIMRELQEPGLSPGRQEELRLRQDELAQATATQQNRMADLEAMPEGWIAAPHRGAQQAETLNWPEAPEGYTWVAGSDGTPHLRDIGGNDVRLRYDEASGTFVPNDGAQPMRTVGNGSGLENEATWTTDAQGRLTEVTATLREYHVNAGRSAAELTAQTQMRAQGLSTDDAGHAIGHRFMLDNGLQNMFPQDANFNRGAYKTLENELADWIAAGGEVRITVRPGDYQNGRPNEVEVSYEVYDPNTGRLVYDNFESFENNGSQNFARLTPTEIEQRMGVQ